MPEQRGDSEQRRDVALVSGEPRTFRVSLLRPDDLVALDLECVEMDLITEKATKHPNGSELRTTLRPRAGRDSLLIVHFPPQHVAERAFFEAEASDPTPPKPPDAPNAGASEPLDPPPVQALFANPSRLVFEVPPDYPPIIYSVAGLLRAFAEVPMRISWEAH